MKTKCSECGIILDTWKMIRREYKLYCPKCINKGCEL